MKVNKEIKYVYYLTTIILPYSFRVFLVLKHFYHTPENVVNLPKMLSYAPLQRKFPFHFFRAGNFSTLPARLAGGQKKISTALGVTFAA